MARELQDTVMTPHGEVPLPPPPKGAIGFRIWRNGVLVAECYPPPRSALQRITQWLRMHLR